MVLDSAACQLCSNGSLPVFADHVDIGEQGGHICSCGAVSNGEYIASNF